MGLLLIAFGHVTQLECPGIPWPCSETLRVVPVERMVSAPRTPVEGFDGSAGHLPFMTIELVTFSDGEVGFEHLAGSFHACREKFVLLDEGGGRTRVEHSGTFTMRGGLIGWVAGRLVVRRLFEAHVAEHMRGFGGK